MTSTSKEDVRNVLISAISSELRIPSAELETDRPFTDYGLDSVAALNVSTEVEDTFGLTSIPPTLLWDYPTVDDLAVALWELVNGQLTNVVGSDR
jgi:acyl carrier protein